MKPHWAAIRPIPIYRCHGVAVDSELQLNAALKELRVTTASESIEVAVPVCKFETDVVGEVPVHHGRDSAEGASRYGFAVEIDVGISEDRFPCAWASFEDGTFGIDRSKISSHGVVGSGGVVEEVGRHKVATVEHRVILRSR
jgi:hypothetical protein